MIASCAIAAAVAAFWSTGSTLTALLKYASAALLVAKFPLYCTSKLNASTMYSTSRRQVATLYVNNGKFELIQIVSSELINSLFNCSNILANALFASTPGSVQVSVSAFTTPFSIISRISSNAASDLATAVALADKYVAATVFKYSIAPIVCWN